MRRQSVQALVYLTHRLQLVWYPEPFLLLHIAFWWSFTVFLLLEIANRRVELDAPTNELKKFQTSLRPNALLYGTAPWFQDAESESDDEDFPAGTSLFRSICLHVPPKWKWSSLSIDLQRNGHRAVFGDSRGSIFTVDFENWDFAWMCSLVEVSGATFTDCAAFITDLHGVLSTTNGIHRVRWYSSGANSFHAQMTAKDLAAGVEHPVDSVRAA